jgi:hypothetical protein
MHRIVVRTLKKRASKKPYISPSQLTFINFEAPCFEHPDVSKRWVRLSDAIPWGSIVNVYLNRINNVICQAAIVNRDAAADRSDGDSGDVNQPEAVSARQDDLKNEPVELNERSFQLPNHDHMLVDVSACPKDITYPTDLGYLNTSRVKCEEIIYSLYDPLLHAPVKPRTNLEKARKAYLNTAKNKKKRSQEMKVAIRMQLRNFNRDLRTIDILLCAFAGNPLKEKERTNVETIRKVPVQQAYMRRKKTQDVVDRIVSFH